MATVTQPRFDELSRRTLRFDWAVSLMLAVISVGGVLGVGLLAVFITNMVWPLRSSAVAVDVMEIAFDSEEGATGDETEDLGEGQIISPSDLAAREENLQFDQPEMAEVLASVLDAVGENLADFADPNRKEGEKSAGRAGNPGGTGEEGTGDGSSAIPRYQRWVVEYGAATTKVYAEQLDFFGIALGVVRGNQCSIVSNFSQGVPLVQKGGDEGRLYFYWQDADRRRADVSLVEKAKVPADKAMIVQFYPRELEQRLALLERQHAGKMPEQIKKTIFGVRPTAAGYEFHVKEQVFVD